MKPTLIYLIIFSIILCFVSTNSFSRYSRTQKYFSAYLGGTYAFDSKYAHSVGIEKWTIKSTCIYSSYKGYGLSTEFYDSKNYRIGIRYFFSPQRHPNMNLFLLYFGLEPNVNFKEGNESFGITPQAGMHICEVNAWPIDLNLFYGYNVPFDNNEGKEWGGHRITLRVGFYLN